MSRSETIIWNASCNVQWEVSYTTKKDKDNNDVISDLKINNIDYDFDFNGNNMSRTDHNGNAEIFSSNNIVEHKNINQPFKVEEDGTCSHDFNIDNFRGSHTPVLIMMVILRILERVIQ